MNSLSGSDKYSTLELSQHVAPAVLLIRACRGPCQSSYSLDAVICTSGIGLFPLTNGSSTLQDGSFTRVISIKVTHIYLYIILFYKWTGILLFLLCRTLDRLIFLQDIYKWTKWVMLLAYVLPVSHNLPLYPSSHWHEKFATRSKHVPPFRHGRSAQPSISVEKVNGCKWYDAVRFYQ